MQNARLRARVLLFERGPAATCPPRERFPWVGRKAAVNDATPKREKLMKRIPNTRAVVVATALLAMAGPAFAAGSAPGATGVGSAPGVPTTGGTPGITPGNTTLPGGSVPYQTTTPTVNSPTGTTGVTTAPTPGAMSTTPTNTTPGATPAPLGTTNCAPAIGANSGCAPGTATTNNGITTPPETAYPLSPGTSTPQ